MKKESAKKLLAKTVSRLASLDAKENAWGPFPPCIGIFYQPKRPKKLKDKIT